MLPPSPPASQQAGLTLIELIAMVVMIGITAIVFVPRLAALTDYESRSLHDKLIAELQHARQAAIANRRYVCVGLTNGVGGKLSFTIENSQPESTSGTCNLNLNLLQPSSTPGCSTNEVCAGSRISISASTTLLQFSPQGKLSPSSAITLAVPGETNITIEAESGYVH